MRAPAAAALLLAALSALPCRGTDTEALRHTAHRSNTPPIITKLYRMLHASEINQTETNFNYSSHSFDFQSQMNETITTRSYINKTHVEGIQVLNDHEQISPEKHQSSIDTDKPFKLYKDDIKTEENRIFDTNIVEDSRNRKRRVVNVVREATTPSVMMMERRRKVGETGSSAPLLNYIFDTYSNTHQHHRNDKVGTGSGIYAAGALEIEALVGSTAHLDCKVDALHDKLVSWVRRKSEEDPMELLYTGTQQYTADDRYSSKFIPPDIWRLEVKEVRASDASHYDCQMPTHPPRAARVTLRVPEVSVLIVDGAGAKVSEQVCELGSTVALRCEVRGLKMEGGPSLLWYRKEDLLNDDTTRGGISVRTEFGSNGANSVLRVARVRGDDAGRYTCTVARAPPPGPPPAHVILHVIKGESLAELHQAGATLMSCRLLMAALSLFVLLHSVIITLIY